MVILDNKHILKYLLDNFIINQSKAHRALITAIKCEDYESSKLLLEFGIHPKTYNETGHSPHKEAFFNKNSPTGKKILDLVESYL
jgi:hypothetical protein